MEAMTGIMIALIFISKLVINNELEVSNFFISSSYDVGLPTS